LSICYPLGAFVQGDLARSVGVRSVTVAGAITLGVMLTVLRLGAPGYWRAMGSPPTNTAPILAD
jgi:hypothetical protein